MTVCISGRSSAPRDFIIAVSDAKLSNDWRSQDDGMTKLRNVGTRWHVMFSANRDLPSLQPILGSVDAALKGTTESLREVQDAFRAAYGERLNAIIQDRILSPYKMTVDDWKADGLIQFGSNEFSRINAKIEAVTIDLKLLVCGFDECEEAHHFIANPDEGELIEDWSFQDYCVIGAGQYLADAALAAMPKQDRDTPFENYLLMMLCFAKFTAESAPSVGKSTTIRIFYNDGSYRYINEDVIDQIRQFWRRRQEAAIPHRIARQIEKEIDLCERVTWEDGLLVRSKPSEPSDGEIR
jgi:hypothetical protein